MYRAQFHAFKDEDQADISLVDVLILGAVVIYVRAIHAFERAFARTVKE